MKCDGCEGYQDGFTPAYDNPALCECCGLTFGEHAFGGTAEEPHVGHYSKLGGTWFCDTCNSPCCDLA